MSFLDLDLCEVSKLIKERKVSSEQLTKECLEKIKQTQSLNALNCVYEDMALKRAREIDKRIQNG